ncbi:MAG: maleate cis-trans isomerase [Crenarchaeota archaeon]|nr:maleate cis-trans isomerase [Thermoproteota archaeon]
MYKLGVIIPSSNTTVEQEFSFALHKIPVSLHFARVPLKDVTIDGLSEMEKETEYAAQLLNDAQVDAIVFACTSASLLKGKGHDKAIAKKIIRVANCPVVVTSGAVVDALKKIGVKKITLATPYIKEINEKEKDFLEQNGFEVISIQSLGLTENLEIGKLTMKDALKIAVRADTKLAEAIFISCTNFMTFQAIPILEKQLKKPIISSNSATLWAAFNALQIKEPMQLGKLFDT